MSNVIVTTRIDSEVHAAAKKLSKADGRSLSNYLRRLVEQDVLQRTGAGDPRISRWIGDGAPTPSITLSSGNGSRPL